MVKNENAAQGGAAEHDIYTDPALARETRDPIADFLKSQWRPLFVGILLIFAVIYVKNTMQESYQRGLETSADALFKAQEAFDGFKEAKKKVAELEAKPLSTDAKAKETELKDREAALTDLKSREERMQQTLAVLGDSKAPYNKIADLFKLLIAHERGDVSAMRTALGQYSTESLPRLKGADRFVGELSLIALGRALLDTPETGAEGKRILIALAKQGEIVAVSAALTVSRIASTDDEKKEAQALIAELALKNPEQAAALQEQ